MAPRHGFLFKGFLFLLLIVYTCCPPLVAKIIEIPTASYPTIQSGIDSAQHGDTVLVQPDRYFENINFNGKNIVVGSLFTTTGDTSYISQTIIDGNESGCVVVFEDGEDSTACIGGFTITNGNAPSDVQNGGGITCMNSSSPTLSYLRITKNISIDDNFGGGGIACADHSCPVIRNVEISENETEYGQGGGIFCLDSANVKIFDCQIRNNRGAGMVLINSVVELNGLIIEGNRCSRGGGIYLEYADVNITDVQILNNEAWSSTPGGIGGGICSNGSSFILNRVTISNNIALEFSFGGGIYIGGSNGIIENSTISNNRANGFGGGIYCTQSSSLTLKNVILEENKVAGSGGSGGGISIQGASLSMEKVKIAKNFAGSEGGGIYSNNSLDLNLKEVAICKNSAESQGGGIFCNEHSQIVFNNSFPSSIYLNRSCANGSDIFYQAAEEITAVLDTFTVSDPNDYHLYPRDKFNINFQHALFETVDADLYVSPDGTDENSGISPSEPLGTINFALLATNADSANPKTIHIAPGLYSSTTLGEDFPLYGRSYVSLVGDAAETTILDGAHKTKLLSMSNIENLEIKNLTIQNGYAESYGGGISSSGVSDVLLTDLTIRNNKAHGWGGGISFRGGNCVLKNLLIYNNEVENVEWYDHFEGAGIYIEGGKIDLINLTISNNSVIGPDQQSSLCGGLKISNFHSPTTIINSTILNNFPYNVGQDGYSEMMITHSNIEGGEEGIIQDTSKTTLDWLEGNIDEDPLFVGGDPYDYHLSEGSPCIDAGTPFFAWQGDTILDLSPEEYDGDAPDMGAFGIDPISYIKKENIIPLQFKLFQNYPNPFNSITVLSWQLAVGNNVDLSIYNILGQRVATLLSKRQPAGFHQVEWDAHGYASGLYFCKLSVGSYTKVRKLLFIK